MEGPMRHLPNLLTGLRLALSVLVFLALATAGGATPWLSDQLTGAQSYTLAAWSFFAFVTAAVTDFFDGWLARRLNATSVWGAILDPIADKVLVCATALGLLALAPNPSIVIPLGLILFREFAISALREVTAGKGVSLPVTLLAKWKTTFQLVALAAELAVAAWIGLGLPDDPVFVATASVAAHALLWVATVVTLITGAQYLAQARKGLAGKA
jgi:CDP-diacylglycerol--glycerol-3-phosphate 3-phosphatidyltransferase